MFVEYPILGAQPRDEQAVARLVKPCLVQQRQPGRATGCVMVSTQPGGAGIGGHADIGPDAPVDRDHAGCAALPAVGKGVEIFVGGHVIDLTRRAAGGRGRGTEHHQFQHPVGEELVQHPKPGHLGRQDTVQIGLGLGQCGAVRDMARGMDHAGKRAEPVLGLAQCTAHLVDIGHIGGNRHHLATFQRLQLGQGTDATAGTVGGAVPGQPGGAVGGQRITPQQDHVGAVLVHQVTGQRQADTAETAGDQIGATIAEGRPCVSQRRRAVTAAKPLTIAPGGNRVAGFSQQLFEHRRGQVLVLFGCRTTQSRPKRWAQTGGQFDIDGRTGQVGHFMRQHPHRPGDGGLFGIGQPLVAQPRRARGKGGDVQRSGQVHLSQRLRQPGQAKEAVFHVAVMKAGAGAEPLILGHQPEMADPVRQPLLLGQIAQQQVIAHPPLFGRERIAAIVKARITVARADAGDMMASTLKSLRGGLGQPGFVHEEQPVARRGLGQLGRGVDVAIGQTRAPDRAPAPLAQIVAARGQGARRLGLPGAGLDEIAAALKGIGRQGQAVAKRLAPDLGPIGLDPAGPEPTDHAQEIGIIGNVLIGVAQAAQHLAGRHAGRHLCQRAQRLAGTHLQEHPVAVLGQGVDTIGEMHRVAQLCDPVVGAGSLCLGQHRAGAV